MYIIELQRCSCSVIWLNMRKVESDDGDDAWANLFNSLSTTINLSSAPEWKSNWMSKLIVYMCGCLFECVCVCVCVCVFGVTCMSMFVVPTCMFVAAFVCHVCSVCLRVCSCMWCVSVFLCVVSEVCLYVCVFVCSVCTLRVCLWCLSCESVCV